VLPKKKKKPNNTKKLLFSERSDAAECFSWPQKIVDAFSATFMKGRSNKAHGILGLLIGTVGACRVKLGVVTVIPATGGEGRRISRSRPVWAM
jgi:hypothetical protein